MNIDLSNLTMTYPSGKTALQSLNLKLESPSLIGLLGPNGAGKSTLMKLLTAALLPTGGRIAVNGQPLERMEWQLKAKLGYLPQSFGLYDELSVQQFLAYMAALKGLKGGRADIERVIELTNLGEKRRSRIGSLSGGQRQRVGIAQALLGDPALLILDEPTVGLDPEERVHFRNLFSQTARDRLVILSTHIIEDVQSVCDRLVVMDRGAVLFVGAPEKLMLLAKGHVGVLEGEPQAGDGCDITSRVHTAAGVVCRCVAERLPQYARQTEPTLEDAYLYLMRKEAAGA